MSKEPNPQNAHRAEQGGPAAEEMTSFSRERDGGQFPLTCWTLVCRAQDATQGSAHKALSKLCEMYWYPLYAFVRRCGCDRFEAEDVTQGFFGELLAKDYFASVTAEKGRLRSFLMVCIKRYLAKWRSRAYAGKRGGGRVHVSIDQVVAEKLYRLEPADLLTPEVLYDRHWALTLMRHARDRLAEEYAARDKAELFEALGGTLSTAKSSRPYGEIAARFGMTEGNIRAIASRMRKRYRILLEDEIAQTLQSVDEMDDELDHLLKVFGEPGSVPS